MGVRWIIARHLYGDRQIFLKKSSSISYVVTGFTPMPYYAILEINSSPSIKSICCFPGLDASSLAAFEKVPVVIMTPYICGQ